MRRWLIIGFALFPSCSTSTKISSRNLWQLDHSPVSIVIAGQSNGSSYISGDMDVQSSVTQRVQINGRPAYGLSNNASWIKLGDFIVAQFDRDVKIWNVSKDGKTSKELLAYLPEIQASVAANKPKFFIWVQGESDTVSGESELDSYSSYKTIFEAVRSASPDTIAFVSINGLSLIAPVRNVQRRMVREGLAREGVDIDRMRVDHPEWFGVGIYEGLGVHFVSQGLTEHGKAWFEVVKSFI